MTDQPDVSTVEEGDEYVHVRIRDPDEFDSIRTPDWARRPAESVSDGAEVRTGRREGSDEWVVQSVLLETDVDEDAAVDHAREILEKIED